MSNYVELAMRTDNAYGEDVMQRLQNRSFVRLLHSAMGICTEAGELMDVLKKHLFYGKPIDYVNIQEEYGDLCWYKSLGLDVLVEELKQHSREEIEGFVQEKNIQKLAARYPEKFTCEKALERDLDKEREILETV